MKQRTKLFAIANHAFLNDVIKDCLNDTRTFPTAIQNLIVVAAGKKSRVAVGQIQQMTVYVKIYQDRWPRRILSFSRASRAHREFQALNWLRLQIDNPVQPLAWGEKKRFGITASSVIITRAFENSVDLRALRGQRESAVRGSAVEVLRDQELIEILKKVMLELRLLHDSGTYLGDGFAKNLLINPYSSLKSWAWIDQPHLVFHGSTLPWNLRINELARLSKFLEEFLPHSQFIEVITEYFPKNLSKTRQDETIQKIQRAAQKLRTPSLSKRLRVWTSQ